MFIEIARERTGFRARVKLVDANNDVRGKRELAQASTSCSGMIDALALSISIAIDPDSLARPAPTPALDSPAVTLPEPRTEPAPEALPSSEPDKPVAADTVMPPRRSQAAMRGELWLAPTFWLGSGPPSTFGGEVGGRARWTHASLGLSFRGDLPSTRSVDGVDVSFGFVGASATACGHVSVFSACGLGTLGRLTASSNASVARDDSTLRFLLGGSLGAELPIEESLRVFARAIGNVGVGDQSVVLSGARAYDLPRASLGFQLGAATRF